MGDRYTSSPGRDAAEARARDAHNQAIHDRNVETLKQANRVQGGGGSGGHGCATVILAAVPLAGLLTWMAL